MFMISFLAALASPSPNPAPTFIPAMSAAVRTPYRGDNACADRVVRPFLYASQAIDSLVTANAVHRGSNGVKFFNSSTAAGFVLETAILDIVVHLAERRAPCAVKTATDAILSGAAINNAASAEFPR